MTDDPVGPAEARLLELLAPLRADPPRAEPGTALAVVRTARWQSPVRTVLRVAGVLVAGAADAARALFGLGARRGSGR